jgi:cytoskeletal protein CcmA (bactofilin family)
MKFTMKRTHTPTSKDGIETIDTLIGTGSKIKGDLEFSGCIRIDGNIIGNISTKDASDGALVLSESGVIDGDINVSNLVVNGTVNGNIHSSGHVELQSKAKVTGDIRYAALEIGLGATLDGKLVSNNSAPNYEDVAGGTKQPDTKLSATKQPDTKKSDAKPGALNSTALDF